MVRRWRRESCDGQLEELEGRKLRLGQCPSGPLGSGRDWRRRAPPCGADGVRLRSGANLIPGTAAVVCLWHPVANTFTPIYLCIGAPTPPCVLARRLVRAYHIVSIKLRREAFASQPHNTPRRLLCLCLWTPQTPDAGGQQHPANRPWLQPPPHVWECQDGRHSTDTTSRRGWLKKDVALESASSAWIQTWYICDPSNVPGKWTFTPMWPLGEKTALWIQTQTVPPVPLLLGEGYFIKQPGPPLPLEDDCNVSDCCRDYLVEWYFCVPLLFLHDCVAL